jgi:hypothetical protein
MITINLVSYLTTIHRYGAWTVDWRGWFAIGK